MRIFHLSDLHIGLKLFQRDLLEDQRYVLGQIVEMAGQEQPDAIVIAGDLYDRAVPSAAATEVFDWFLSGLRTEAPETELMLISGNHDSALRINVFREILSGQKIHMIGMPPTCPEDRIEKVTLEDAWGAVDFYLLPFVRPSMVRQIIMTEEEEGGISYNEALHRLISREHPDPDRRNVLVSHQFYLPVGTDPETVPRMDSELRTAGNIDEVRADVLEPFDYAALGHIHKPMKVGRENWRYCGTPLACSVSEAGQQKGVILAELREKGNVQIRVLPLTPLHSIRIVRGTLLEVLEQASEDYVTVILTDRADPGRADLYDRLRHAFPNLLEIRRENDRRSSGGTGSLQAETILDPLALCSAFLKDADAQDLELLREVLETVQAAKKQPA